MLSSSPYLRPRPKYSRRNPSCVKKVADNHFNRAVERLPSLSFWSSWPVKRQCPQADSDLTATVITSPGVEVSNRNILMSDLVACFGYQQFRLIDSTRKEDKGMYACGRKEPRRAVEGEVIQESPRCGSLLREERKKGQDNVPRWDIVNETSCRSTIDECGERNGGYTAEFQKQEYAVGSSRGDGRDQGVYGRKGERVTGKQCGENQQRREREGKRERTQMNKKPGCNKRTVRKLLCEEGE